MNNYVETSAKTVDDAVRKALAELGASEDEVTVEVLEEEAGGFLGIGAKAKVRVTKIQPEDVPAQTEEPAAAEESETEAAAADEAAEEDSAAAAEASEDAVYEDDEEETALSDEDEADEADEEADEDQAAEDKEAEFQDKLVKVADVVEDFLQSVLRNFKLEDVNHVTVKEEDGRILADIDGDDCGILIGRKGETLHSLQYITSLVANKTGKARMRVTLDIGGYKAKRENSVASLALRTAQRAVRTQQAYELTPMSAAERRVVHETLQGFKGVTTYSEGDEPNRYVVIDLVFDDEEFEDEDI